MESVNDWKMPRWMESAIDWMRVKWMELAIDWEILNENGLVVWNIVRVAVKT